MHKTKFSFRFRVARRRFEKISLPFSGKNEKNCRSETVHLYCGNGNGISEISVLINLYGE